MISVWELTLFLVLQPVQPTAQALPSDAAATSAM
jgi:hypothetical protein